MSNGDGHVAPQESVDTKPVENTSATANGDGQQQMVPVHALEPSDLTVHAATEKEKEVVVEASSSTEQEKQTEKRENGSLTTTLTGRDSRKAQPPSSSEKSPLPNSNDQTATRVKPSFMSRLLHILLPCIPSSPPEVDVGPSEALPSSREKAANRVTEPTSSDSSQPIAPPTQSPDKGASTSALNAGLSVNTTAPIPDAQVILPPTPTTQLLPPAETEGMTSGAVVPPGSTGTPTTPSRHSNVPTANGDESDGSYTEDEDLDDMNQLDEAEDEEDRLISNGGAGIPIGSDGVPKPLLPPISPEHAGRKCLVLDLDETLVHSSFKSIQQADYVVPVEIEYHWHNVYVIKRPGVDNFLKKMGEIYEVVVFTASLSKYADPVLDKLDIHQVVTHRLFRESCYNHKGNYVKDLSQLGRPIADTIILDNSPASYIFHPNNAVPVSSWFNDPHDTELTDLVPFLTDLAAVEDVRGVLDGAR